MPGLSSHRRSGPPERAGDNTFLGGLLLVLIAAITVSLIMPWD